MHEFVNVRGCNSAMQDISGQKADLEDFVAKLRGREEALEGALQQAKAVAADAELQKEAAIARADQLQQQLDALSAENRVLQENVKGMRQECTERWVCVCVVNHANPDVHLCCVCTVQWCFDFAVTIGICAMQVNEQSALGQLHGLQNTITQLEQTLAQQQARVRQLDVSLETQLGVNRQLMAKKEEVEWQLMAAMTKVGRTHELYHMVHT